MNNMFRRMAHVVAASVLAACLAGCESNPLGRLINPERSDASVAPSGRWLIFGDELRTNGATMFLTTDEGQKLDFNCLERPYDGEKCIKYSWDGSAVTQYSNGLRQSDFVGFMLIAAPTLGEYDTVTRDLSAGGYTKVAFSARGSLGTNVFLRVETENANYKTPSGVNAWQSNTSDRPVTSQWKRYEFALSGSLAAVKDFIRIVIRYDEDGDPDAPNTATTSGGTVYIDTIEYLR